MARTAQTSDPRAKRAGLTTHFGGWPPGGTIRTGVPVCVQLSRDDAHVSGPRDPIDRCGTRPRPARQSGWPGPQGHGDSIGMADHRAARLSPFLLGRKARIQGPPLGPWPTAVRKPHGPTARPSLHPRESQGAARHASGILTRRAETSIAQALFMSSPPGRP
jgi:hypothetical protein